MGKSQEEMKHAVDSGYWQMYRYNPELEATGKNPLVLDSRKPTIPVEEYLKTQGRFRHLFEPERDSAMLEQLQARVDAYWEGVQESPSRADNPRSKRGQ